MSGSIPLSPTNFMTKSFIDILSNAEFLKLIETSESRSDIFHKLGMRKSSNSFHILNRRIKRDNVNISNFKIGSNYGQGIKLSDDKVYVENSPHRHIRDRVTCDQFMEYKCSICKIDPVWNKEELILELDHINGIRNDNRKENLRWLCPNCHSQTSTFCMKNRIL